MGYDRLSKKERRSRRSYRDRIEEVVWQLVVDAVHVTGEAVDDATSRRDVEEANRCAHESRKHLCVQVGRAAARAVGVDERANEADEECEEDEGHVNAKKVPRLVLHSDIVCSHLCWPLSRVFTQLKVVFN